MDKLQDLLDETRVQLVKAIDHLEYSFNKIKRLDIIEASKDDESLETWESFCARFARVADIFLMKYIRLSIKLEDPGFNGTFRDVLNYAEKISLIEDMSVWLKIRALRNTIAHDYAVEDIAILLNAIKQATPTLLKIREIIRT